MPRPTSTDLVKDSRALYQILYKGSSGACQRCTQPGCGRLARGCLGFTLARFLRGCCRADCTLASFSTPTAASAAVPALSTSTGCTSGSHRRASTLMPPAACTICSRRCWNLTPYQSCSELLPRSMLDCGRACGCCAWPSSSIGCSNLPPRFTMMGRGRGWAGVP